LALSDPPVDEKNTPIMMRYVTVVVKMAIEYVKYTAVLFEEGSNEVSVSME
jgi:hypothetical protein